MSTNINALAGIDHVKIGKCFPYAISPEKLGII